MGEHAADPGASTPAAAPASVPVDLAQFYTRADAAIADLDAWGQPIANEFQFPWGPTPGEREGTGRA